MTVEPQPSQTTAFYAQAAISFAVSLGALTIGILYLPADPWMRAFLAVSALFTVSSTITLSKAVRDAHEQRKVISRVDEVRLEKFITEHDPFGVT